MKVNFNFDTGARRIRLKPEDPLEECVLKEMAHLGTKGVNMQIRRCDDLEKSQVEFEIEMRINGHSEGKKAE